LDLAPQDLRPANKLLAPTGTGSAGASQRDRDRPRVSYRWRRLFGGHGWRPRSGPSWGSPETLGPGTSKDTGRIGSWGAPTTLGPDDLL